MSSNVTVMEARIMEIAEKINELIETGKYDKYSDAIDHELRDRSMVFRERVLRCCYYMYFQSVWRSQSKNTKE